MTMWTTENKDDKAILKEIEAELPSMWRVKGTSVGKSGLVATLTPFAPDTWSEMFYVPTARNSRSPGSTPHFDHLDDKLAKDIIKTIPKAERVFKSFSDDIEIINEDYFRKVLHKANVHIEHNKRDRKTLEEEGRPDPLQESSWGWSSGTAVYEPYLRIAINSIDYSLLKEDFIAIATEKRDVLISIIFKEAEKGVYDKKKFDLVGSLYEEIEEKRGYKTFSEYQSIIEPLLSLRSVPETDFLKYIKSVSDKDNFIVLRRKGGIYIDVSHHSRNLLEDFGILEDYGVYDLYTFNSFSNKEKEQYFALKELIPKLPRRGKQRDHIFRLLGALLGRRSISKEDLSYAMVIFGRFGLSEHQHLFGTPPRRENLQKVVLDSTSKEKVQMLEEAINRTRGYNSEVLAEFKAMIESGQSLDSDQLKQIRAIFYRIGMKPQTNSFRKATEMRRSASEVIRNLENRIARLERQAHTMSKKDRARLDELQLLEDQDSLNSKQNKEYEGLVKEYRLTDEYKSNQKRASMSVRDSSKKVMKTLSELDRAMDQMEKSLQSMPSFTSNDRYYQEIAKRWYQLRNNLSTVKKEIDYIKGAY